MSDEQRSLVALLLMVVVLVLWSKFYKPAQKPAAPNPPAVSSSQQPPASPSPSQAKSAAAPARESKIRAAAPNVSAKEAKAEETITVESDLYRVEISNRGGVVKSWRLNKYRDNDKPPGPLELVNAKAAEQLDEWPLSLKLEDPKLEAEANSGLYVVTGDSDATTLHAPAEVDMEWSDGHLDVFKRLKFEKGYQASLSVSASVDGAPLPVGVAWRGGFGDASVYEAAEHVQVFYNSGGKLETLTYKKLGAKDHPDQPTLATDTAEFAGLEDQFFAAAFLPSGPAAPPIAVWDQTQQQNVTADGKTTQQPVVEMVAGTLTPQPWTVNLYVGPKDLTELGKVTPSLTSLVQFGWFGLIAKPLLEVLKWIHRYVPNYGWSIILLTLAITLALFPLKVKGWRAMQKMQKVAPEVKAIQDRYKKYSMKDPRRKGMQDEMMAVYQREGINPMAMGGCLPTLVQLPIIYALWRMLEAAIELRHAPWIWWVHDLSARDPYYILPILVTVTMYFMSKLTPTAAIGDAAQQKMMKYMPLAFGFFFFVLSSGLNLYMLTSNLVGTLQQWYLVKTDPLPSRSPFKKKKTVNA